MQCWGDGRTGGRADITWDGLGFARRLFSWSDYIYHHNDDSLDLITALILRPDATTSFMTRLIE